MEKLSIEQKAEAYDKALENAKHYYSERGDDICNVLEECFPVLRENDDEKVKEQIIYAIKQLHVCDCTKNKYLAWLLKRCEQKPIGWSKEDERIRNILLLSFKNIMIDADEDELWYGLSYNDIIGWLKKQGEQKPTDKIEPKFDIDDWIIYSNEENHLITGFDDNGYFVDKESYIPFNCEGNMRLWTIQDAKDGDVLVDKNNNIGIFRNTKDIYWYSYIYLGCDGELRTPILGCIHEQTDVHPATKEQRDLLFQTMKEAGYELDNEKKELKKIENKKPLLSDFFKAEYERGKADAQKYTEWSEADKHWFENCLYAIKETFKGEDNPHRVGTINWLEYIKDRAEPQPKQEWSEEDEIILKRIIINIENLQFSGDMREEYYRIPNECKNYYQIMIDWLKSLQDRVQLQPKQEEVVLYWESGHPEPHKSVLILRHGNVVVEGEWDEETKRWYQYGWQSYLEDNEVKGWIDKKSLLGNFNFQNHWKPSDEQMYILDQWLKDNQYKGDARYCYPIIDSLYQDLKKLKE